MALHTKVDGDALDGRYLSVSPLLDGKVTVPKHRLPDGPMMPDMAYEIIHDELMLDGNARLNLATFVTTWWKGPDTAAGYNPTEKWTRATAGPAPASSGVVRRQGPPSLGWAPPSFTMAPPRPRPTSMPSPRRQAVPCSGRHCSAPAFRASSPGRSWPWALFSGAWAWYAQPAWRSPTAKGRGRRSLPRWPLVVSFERTLLLAFTATARIPVYHGRIEGWTK
jgi:hypothetical protein